MQISLLVSVYIAKKYERELSCPGLAVSGKLEGERGKRTWEMLPQLAGKEFSYESALRCLVMFVFSHSVDSLPCCFASVWVR